MFLLRGVRRCFNLQKDLKTFVPEKEDEGVGLLVEPNTDEFSEAGGVVVPNGLGVAVRLQDWVGLHHLVLQGGLFLLPLLRLLARRGANEGEVGDNLLRVLRLSGTGLSGDKDRLVLYFQAHGVVRALRNSEDMRWYLLSKKIDLSTPPSNVHNFVFGFLTFTFVISPHSYACHGRLQQSYDKNIYFLGDRDCRSCTNYTFSDHGNSKKCRLSV